MTAAASRQLRTPLSHRIEPRPGGWHHLTQEQKEGVCRWLQEKLLLPSLPTPKQAELLTHPARRSSQPLLFGGAKGGGKGLTNTTNISTPFGWRPIGTLKPGDQVHHAFGGVARVLAVHQRGTQPCYRLTFSSGAQVVCDEDHLWFGWSPGIDYKGNRHPVYGRELVGRVFSVPEIVALMQTKAGRKPGGAGGFCVPVVDPLPYTVQSRWGARRIPPYVLGALLGDGHLGKTRLSLSCADPEIAQRVETLIGEELTFYQNKGSCPVYFIAAVSPIRGEVQRLGLIGKRSWEKFIPPEYLLGTIDERWELLRGLMDTDGYIDRPGKLGYTTTSRQLADDVQALAESLGAIVTRRERIPTYSSCGEKKTGRLAYVLTIKLRDGARAFALPRKRAIAGEPQSLYHRLVSIERIEDQETTCITIDHFSGLFVTEHFIPTHNSSGGALWAIKWSEMIPENRILMCRATWSAFMLSTYQELEKCLKSPGMEHWTIHGHEARNHRNGSEIWWTGVAAETRKKGETEGHKLGSTEFGGIFIDEVPDIPRSIFIELGDRLRHPPAANRNALQYVVTANPYPCWVKEDWITSPKPGYCFIKATMADNPYLYEGYGEDMLSRRTPEEVRALVYGDWDALGPTDQAIPTHLLTAMTRRVEQPNPLDTVWGVDVSRRGLDWTTVWQRSGYRFERLDAWQGLRGTQSADRIADLYARASFKPRRINVDTNGLGADVTDPLVRLSALGMLGECVIDEIFGGRAATDPLHYVNLNAELTGKLESLVRSGRGQILPDPEQKVLGDLGILKYTWQQGRKRVQNNEEIRGQLGRSPDDGNALVYTLYEGREDYVPDFDGTDDDPDSLDGLGEDDRMQVLLRRESKRKADTLMTNFYTGLGLDVGDLYAGLGSEDDLSY